MEVFDIQKLNFSYPMRDRKALDDITLTIECGDFVTICGQSGCGKSTLLRHLKTVLTPHGEKSGSILFQGNPLETVGRREQTTKIGYVLQNPDNQIVTDKVWHELAFGLESLGIQKETIRLRVAEMASFFGIGHWFHRHVTELSGGQKQLLNLASIMAMQPSVLILDEPTSQLDPIAASEFIGTLVKINQEIGTTIIITEHRLEEVLPLSNRVIVMDKGQVIEHDTPKTVGANLKRKNHPMFLAMPSPMQIYSQLDTHLDCPLTVKEGRKFLTAFVGEKCVETVTAPLVSEPLQDIEPIITIKDVWFKYEKKSADIIKDLNLTIYKGEKFALVGGNGTGKTTMLTLLSKINTPYRGKISIHGKELKKYKDNDLFDENLGVLPQNPQSIFVKKTVELDLLEMLGEVKISKEEKMEKVKNMAELVEITHLLQAHPYDLSGGEQQRAALGKVLLLKPKILLLDEPTKGLDRCFKMKLMDILNRLQETGVTIVLVSHDIEFCASFAHRCAMFFDGNVVTVEETHEFFKGNSFYTTAANRMARHLFQEAVTNEDVIYLCQQ